MKLEWKLNGRKVSGHALARELTKSFERGAVDAASKHVVEKLGKLRCPVHGVAPEIRVTGKTLRDWGGDMNVCCEAMRAEVRRVWGKG